MPKCLIVDSMHESIQKILEGADIHVDYKPDIERHEILDSLSDYEVLVVRTKTPVDKELIDRGKKLRLIARAGAGVDNFDIEYMNKGGIEAINAPEGNRDAVGDHTLAMLLSLLNKINVADKQVKQLVWDREGNRGTELGSKTVGIIGYGNMGTAFAKRLRGFDCRVLAVDKYKKEFTNDYVKEASLQELYKNADILSLHVPLTPETCGMVDKAFLERFVKKIYLINMARGEVVPMKSVVYGLEKDIIAGAALDVLECEDLTRLNPEQKIHFQSLSASDKVLMTPHVGGWTIESYKKISEILARKIVNKMR